MVIFFHMERAPRNLASNLWVIDRPFKLPYVGVDIGTRMTCIRLADGRLFLHSPVKLDGVLRSSLDALGEVRSVVAPNKLHHLFLAEYITSYRGPSCTLHRVYPKSGRTSISMASWATNRRPSGEDKSNSTSSVVHLR